MIIPRENIPLWLAAMSRWLPAPGRFLAGAFVGLALPTCIILALLTPPGQVADEPAHILRAAALLQGEFVGHRVVRQNPDGTARVDAGVDADPVLLQLGGVLPPS